MLKLELSEQMVQVIAEGLGLIPYKFSAPVIAEMQKQINAQSPSSQLNGNSTEEKSCNAASLS